MSAADVIQQLENHVATIERVKAELAEEIVAVAGEIAAALGRGNKVLVMGNGGSAADAQHLAAELVGRFLLERKALPAIALTTDTSILTAVGNDYSFDDLFSRQVEAHAVPGDIVIGISTSGNSRNVCRALALANEVGARTLGLLGRDGGEIAGITDTSLIVSVEETPRIQEAHLVIIHLLCDLIEKRLFS